MLAKKRMSPRNVSKKQDINSISIVKTLSDRVPTVSTPSRYRGKKKKSTTQHEIIITCEQAELVVLCLAVPNNHQ